MLSIISHVLFRVVRNFFLGIGGIIRWFLGKTFNALYFDKFPKELDYYIDNNSTKIDKNGFTVANKNFFSMLIVFILLLLISDMV